MEGRRRNSSIRHTDVRLGTHSLIRVFNHGHILRELDRLLANYLPHHSLPEQSTRQLSSLKTSSFHHSTCCQFPTIAKTDFNKNLIFQLAPFLTDKDREPGINLIIMLLKVIQA